MISSEEALSIICNNHVSLGSDLVDLSKAAGRVLNEPIVADRNFPPFDRVMMDGIAFRHEDIIKCGGVFKVVGQQTAGVPQMEIKDEGTCIEVMTGAILPAGADTVVKFEDTEQDQGRASIASTASVKKGQHVHPEGSDRKRGEELLAIGSRIRPAEIAILSTVGKSKVSVKSLPKVAIVSTGDELVDVDQHPKRHQIRMSNSYSLKTQAEEMGLEVSVFHLIDDRNDLLTALQSIISSNEIVILSGGVSKGRKDFVPEVLEELGVLKLFHGVLQRPGKPFWFGRTNTTAIFALPGNPVSTFMCFHKYVTPYILGCSGQKSIMRYAKLSENFEFVPNLTYFLQVKLEYSDSGELKAMPIPGRGSGDLANLVDADAFMELPAEKSKFSIGEVYPVMSY